MMMTRRLLAHRLLACGLTVLIAAPAFARAGARDEDVFTHRGFTVDMSAMGPERRAAVAGWIRQQIDLVESLNIREDIKVWFRSVRLTVDPALNMPGRVDRNGLTLNDEVSPPENPVLLHELLHVYQARRLTGARDNPHLVAAFTQAKRSGDWPPQAYMLSNINEFFAMTGSVALWGRAARPPSTRERLRAAMPDWYAFLVEEFGLTA